MSPRDRLTTDEAYSVLAGTEQALVEKAQRAIELVWCWWPGDWDSFAQGFEEDGEDVERAVIATISAEGLSALAEQRKRRTEEYLGARIPEYISMLEEIAKDAGKIDIKTGVHVSDNNARLTAIRMLVELANMHRKKAFPTNKHVATSVKDVGSEMRKIVRGLAKGSGRVVAREVSFESDAGVEDGVPPTHPGEVVDEDE